MGLTRPKYSQIYDTDWKQSVELATTGDVGNLILANLQPNSIDGVTVQTNYRILVKDQTNGWENGIYLVRSAGTGSNGWWERSLDTAQSSFVTAGLTVSVVSGNSNGGKEYKLTTPDPITLGVTSLTFINPFAAAGAAGANTQVQFNDASSLNGVSGFTFNKYTNVATISGNIVSTSGYFLGDGSKLTGIDATSIQSGTTSVKTYSSSNVAISVGGSANTVVFTSSNVIVSGSVLPGANLTYDLGSPTAKFRSAYFGGNTVYIGKEAIKVNDTTGTWTFTSNGTNITIDSTSVISNIYLDNSTGYIGFNDTSPDFDYDFTSPNGGELLHIETTVATQAWYGARNYGGLEYQAGVDQTYVFSGSRTRADHYVLMTNGITRANIHGSTGNVIFSNSIFVNQEVSTNNFIANSISTGASNITIRSDVTSLGHKVLGISQLAIGTENDLVYGTDALYVTGNDSTIDGDLTIIGNLFVNGNTTTFNSNNLSINDALIYLADDNPADTLDIGFVSSFTSAVRYQHTGLVRDASDSTWKLFANVIAEPTTTVDFTSANYSTLLVGNLVAVGNLVVSNITAGGSTGTNGQYLQSTGSGMIWSSLSPNKINQNASNVAVTESFVNVAVNGTNVATFSSLYHSITGYLNVAGNILSGGNIVAGGNVIAGAARFSGFFDESTTASGVFVGNAGSGTPSPRIGFFNSATAQNWQIDNYNGVFRWFTPGVTQMSLNSSGVLSTTTVNASGNVLSTGAIHNSLTVNGDMSVGNITTSSNAVANIGSVSNKFRIIHAQATQAQYADLAEVYTSDQLYPGGTVVVFGGSAEVMQSHSSHDPRIAGVVSTDPAYLMNSGATGVPVALQGRVPCRVLGPLEQGDRVVSSHIPGVAQRLDPQQYEPGCIIGKALQAIESTDISIIEVVVGRL